VLLLLKKVFNQSHSYLGFMNSSTDKKSLIATKHLIFGVGLIGAYLAGAFLNSGVHSHLYGRPSALKKLNKGITLTDFNHNHSLIEEISFADDQDPVAYDVVWLTVKCTALSSIKKDLARFLHANSLIVCCQNGVESHLEVQSQFPNHLVARAMVPFNVVSDKDGHFHRGSEGSFVIENIDKDKFDVSAFANTVNSELLPTAITNDMTALQWAKLQLNLGNAVNALANVPVKSMLQNRVYRLIIAYAMHELLDVTEAKSITLPKVANIANSKIPWVLKLPNWLFSLLAQQMLKIDPKVRTSMWWDLQASKPTEVDYLHQKVVEQAEQLGLKCEVNKWLVSKIKEYERLNTQGINPFDNDFEQEAKVFLRKM
jgi:2-dehydropantoate 2-reductase